ncbi:alkyl hydroperoxide reductase subunit F [Melaminivora alkalimesophila]|uniref:Alkyl hydroperoxide reductase subunit F n=1 Tax=Melaminivora alkalimesophila TaxID=1165852 RepID=A0A317RGG2_9BURK|nr:alkyl hydroperoxide reductase subunit F [Melaminivora alkalimesophila]PWW48841.1 alkyl hydroperoxide reductase subunit F [Melaminivora alkalimesophila]
MLDANLQAQLKAYLERLQRPVELVATLDDSDTARELRELLQQIRGLSDKITVVEANDAAVRKPSFLITNPGVDTGVRFAGVPLGHEFTSLVLALLHVGGHPSKEAADLLEQVKNLDGEFHFETYYSLSCHNCPDVVQALNLMSVLNPRITHTAIDGAVFQDEIKERQVMGVPTVFLNGEHFGQGRMELAEIVGRLDKGAAARDAAKMNEKEPFDVLVIGGGPAGAAAAIYAARKGIRTAIAAERFGGQVLDTLDIENYISIRKTEGPQFAAALEHHVRDYEVDLMNLQKARALRPATSEGGLIEVEMENGAVLRGRSVILATGARWRNMGVPGEDEYRTRGVAYCPSCDGPLFKGKPVAVIGGGNSGVEAAIDLAGVVSHVTLLEFAPELKADAVLQRKLRSLPNVDIIVNAQTTEVKGDGQRVTGLVYKDRETGEVRELPLEGIFVQIGLLPNTEWLKGTVELSRFGEIVIDARNHTNVPGVFAAGDCTIVPYKQIVIAAGEGSKAALSAFDYLIRTTAPAA